MNRSAQALGRRAKGVPKKYSAEQIELRTARLVAARAARWKNHKKK
jgi:hypothetical protein